jgi:hypothetical protein
MKILLFGLALLGFSATTALGDVSKDDVKALLRIGTSEAEIRSYVEAHRPVLPLSADDLRDLRASGASDDLLVFLITPPVPPAVPPVPSSDPYPYPYDSYGYSTYPPDYYYPYPYYSYYPYPYYYPWFGFSFVVPFHDHHDFHHDMHHDHFQHPLPPPHPGTHVPMAPVPHGNPAGHAGGMSGHGGHR